ncbi:MAG: hypothetical protein HQL14_08540 [Candidatus Omnitrophica bacterium]|nr:hypothetical protein [Candidatus Omnitrophota bacterium]
MNQRTPLFIILAMVSITLIPWVNNLIWKTGACLYRIFYPFAGVCLFGPLILVLGIIQCLGGKESSAYRSGMWYMAIGTIMITYALSFSYYSVGIR